MSQIMYIDPAKEIQELKAMRDVLNQHLLTPGISENERITIRQQIIAHTKAMTVLYGQLPRFVPGPIITIPSNFPSNQPLVKDHPVLDPKIVREQDWMYLTAYLRERYGRTTRENTDIVLSDDDENDVSQGSIQSEEEEEG